MLNKEKFHIFTHPNLFDKHEEYWIANYSVRKNNLNPIWRNDNAATSERNNDKKEKKEA